MQLSIYMNGNSQINNYMEIPRPEDANFVIQFRLHSSTYLYHSPAAYMNMTDIIIYFC